MVGRAFICRRIRIANDGGYHNVRADNARRQSADNIISGFVPLRCVAGLRWLIRTYARAAAAQNQNAKNDNQSPINDDSDVSKARRHGAKAGLDF